MRVHVLARRATTHRAAPHLRCILGRAAEPRYPLRSRSGSIASSGGGSVTSKRSAAEAFPSAAAAAAPARPAKKAHVAESSGVAERKFDRDGDVVMAHSEAVRDDGGVGRGSTTRTSPPRAHVHAPRAHRVSFQRHAPTQRRWRCMRCIHASRTAFPLAHMCRQRGRAACCTICHGRRGRDGAARRRATARPRYATAALSLCVVAQHHTTLRQRHAAPYSGSRHAQHTTVRPVAPRTAMPPCRTAAPCVHRASACDRMRALPQYAPYVTHPAAAAYDTLQVAGAAAAGVAAVHPHLLHPRHIPAAPQLKRTRPCMRARRPPSTNPQQRQPLLLPSLPPLHTPERHGGRAPAAVALVLRHRPVRNCAARAHAHACVRTIDASTAHTHARAHSIGMLRPDAQSDTRTHNRATLHCPALQDRGGSCATGPSSRRPSTASW